jgi:hypothetical protein
MPEQPLPPPRLEAVRGEEQPTCGEHAEHLRMPERPAVGDEMPRCQDADGDRDRAGDDVEGNTGTPRAEEPQKAHPLVHRPQQPGAEERPGDSFLYHGT